MLAYIDYPRLAGVLFFVMTSEYGIHGTGMELTMLS